MNLSNNVQNVCRACLAKSGSFQSIFIRHEGSDMPSLSFAEIIMSTSTSVYIALNDGLPDVICLDCSNKLLEFYQFKLKFERNDLVLRSDVNLAQDKDACQIMIKQENESLNNDVTFVEMNEKNLCDEIEEQGPFRIDDENNISEDDEDDSQPLSLIKGVQIIKQEDLDLDYDLCKIEDNNLLEEQNEPFRINDIKNEADEDIRENLANSAVENLFPKKSKTQYENAYKQFKDWCTHRKLAKVNENTVLAYFEYKSKLVKPSTLWALYSMLKSTLSIKENIDLKKCAKLIPYLKKKSVGHQAKKSKIFTREQVNQFLTEADNEHYLMMKIVLLMGISGACRRDELVKMTVDDINDTNRVLIVKIPGSKANDPRTFTVVESNHIKLYQQYVALRPTLALSKRLFLKYQKGKCVNQVVGINTIGSIPSMIATYLQLPNARAYTGHCFRRTSAIFLADAKTGIV